MISGTAANGGPVEIAIDCREDNPPADRRSTMATASSKMPQNTRRGTGASTFPPGPTTPRRISPLADRVPSGSSAGGPCCRKGAPARMRQPHRSPKGAVPSGRRSPQRPGALSRPRRLWRPPEAPGLSMRLVGRGAANRRGEGSSVAKRLKTPDRCPCRPRRKSRTSHHSHSLARRPAPQKEISHGPGAAGLFSEGRIYCTRTRSLHRCDHAT